MNWTVQVIWRDQTTHATSLLCSIVTDRGISWRQACEILRPPPKVIDLDLDDTVDLDAQSKS